MNGLGMISQTYMFILLVLLFVGSGMAVWSFLNSRIDKASNKPPTKENKVIVSSDPSKAGSTVKKYGGIVMNNGWLKLAVFSFVGILVSVIVLGFVSASGVNTMNMAGNTMTSNSSIHQQHQQQGIAQNGMQMQGTMNPNMQMGNMQGSMNGNMQMQGNMPGMTGQQSGNEYMMMQQQINQMQMQLNQIQQQLGMMNGNMSGNTQMQSGGMSSMPQSGGMSSMPQSGGMGMGMMPMMNMGGSMSSMPQSGGSMPQSGGSMSSMPQSGSGGGMSMM